MSKAAKQDIRTPYVVGALLCEKVLVEKDDTLSIIRSVDRFQIDGKVQIVEEPGVEVSDVVLPFSIEFILLIMLKAFPKTGIQTVTVQPFGPNGVSIGEESPVDLTVTGPMRGANLRMAAQVLVGSSGVHWISVRYRGRELTRVLFEVEDRRTKLRVDPGSPLDPSLPAFHKANQVV